MPNFAERISYWYLRLNGCLLLENYVNHRRPDTAPSDTDLLAVRLRYAKQRIWDAEVPEVDDWNARFGEAVAAANVALVVQAKGGGGDAARAFTDDRVTDAVRRIGAVDEETTQRILQELRTERHAVSGDWAYVKLVIGPTAADCAHHIPLSHAHSFIRERFRNHPRKGPDWNHFTDPIAQLIAWEETRG
jgi:hypothetical protein